MNPTALLTFASRLLAGVTHLPRHRDPPGFREFLKERNEIPPGAMDAPPVVFWGILTAIFLINIGTVAWAMMRRWSRRRAKNQTEDFKSYKPK